jgi:signal transduction histidine kinase
MFFNTVLAMHPENISTIIDQCLKLATPIAQQKGISLRYQSRDQIITSCDSVRLIQLLLNLISNAIKYNVKEGVVDITLEKNDVKSYTINIMDTGLGIEFAKVFDSFMGLTSSEDIEGTGLGLGITKELVTLMGGSIGIKSELGVGSNFWINLPLLTDSHE